MARTMTLEDLLELQREQEGVKYREFPELDLTTPMPDMDFERQGLAMDLTNTADPRLELDTRPPEARFQQFAELDLTKPQTFREFPEMDLTTPPQVAMTVGMPIRHEYPELAPPQVDDKETQAAAETATPPPVRPVSSPPPVMKPFEGYGDDLSDDALAQAYARQQMMQGFKGASEYMRAAFTRDKPNAGLMEADDTEVKGILARRAAKDQEWKRAETDPNDPRNVAYRASLKAAVPEYFANVPDEVFSQITRADAGVILDPIKLAETVRARTEEAAAKREQKSLEFAAQTDPLAPANVARREALRARFPEQAARMGDAYHQLAGKSIDAAAAQWSATSDKTMGEEGKDRRTYAQIEAAERRLGRRLSFEEWKALLAEGRFEKGHEQRERKIGAAAAKTDNKAVERAGKDFGPLKMAAKNIEILEGALSKRGDIPGIGPIDDLAARAGTAVGVDLTGEKGIRIRKAGQDVMNEYMRAVSGGAVVSAEEKRLVQAGLHPSASETEWRLGAEAAISRIKGGFEQAEAKYSPEVREAYEKQGGVTPSKAFGDKPKITRVTNKRTNEVGYKFPDGTVKRASELTDEEKRLLGVR